MKFLQIVLFILLMNQIIVSQVITDDKQWLVLNEGLSYRQNGVYNVINNMSNRLKMIMFSHPSNFTDPSTNQLVQGRNDLFIIYENGSHFNSYSLANNLSWQDENGVFPGVGYRLEHTEKIKYLYYTNVYEEDDPEPETRVQPGNSSTLQELPINVSLPPQRLTVNHTIVENKDVTVIIKGGGECPQSMLCFSGPDGFSNNNTTIKLGPSKVFGSVGREEFGYNVGSPVYSASQQCISNINVNGTYGYINLKIQDQISEYLFDGEMTFNYSSTQSPQCNYSINVPISQAHDPNYVKVQCISTDGKYNYVRYRIHVYNDKEEVAHNLKLYFTPPSAAINSETEIANYNIGGDTYLPQISVTESTGLLSTSKLSSLVINTATALGAFESAFVDICVKFPLSFDILKEPLIHDKANSQFDNVTYNITDFYDLPDTCTRPKPTRKIWNIKAKSSSRVGSSRVVKLRKRRCPREMSSTTDCPCDSNYNPNSGTNIDQKRE